MTYEQFAEIMEPLYRQFRFKMPADWKSKDLGDRYRSLGKFDPDTLTLAVDRLILSEDRMPVPKIIRQACIDAQISLRKTPEEPYKPWDKPNECPCGCGGVRWSYVVIDRQTGEWRHYPKDIEQQTMPFLESKSAEITQLRQEVVAALAGKVMTRDIIECKRAPGTAPRGKFLKTDSRGVDVYLIPLQEL